MSSAEVLASISVKSEVAIAVESLLAARKAGRLIDGLPTMLSTADAFAVQSAVGKALSEKIGGWKCGLPRDGRIIAAPIYLSDMHYPPKPVIVRTPYLRWEPELAFILSRDIPRGIDRTRVKAAIGETRLAIELLHGRYTNTDHLSASEILADGLYNEGLVVGPVIDPDAIFDTITISGPDGKIALAANHPAIDPIAPLVWLANEGPQLLQAGQMIITGSFIAPQMLRADATFDIAFGDAGSMTATFEFEGQQA